MEVELTLCGVIESVPCSEADEVGRGHIVVLVIGIIVAETTLVTGHEVLVLRHSASQPTVPAGILEIPGLLAVDEADAEAFGRAILLNESSESFHSLACRVDVRQHDVIGAVFCQAVLHIGISLECLGTAEDGFGGTLSDAEGVESGAAPFAGVTIVGHCRVAETLAGQRATEFAVEGDELSGAVVRVVKHLEVLALEGIEVLGAGKDARAIGHHLFAHDDSGTFRRQLSRHILLLHIL